MRWITTVALWGMLLSCNQQSSVGDPKAGDFALETCPSQVCTCEQLEAMGFFNPICYGAVPDDTGDDTSAIQTAIANAGLNGIVFIPGGMYLVSSTLDFSGRRITGVHHGQITWGGTVIKADGGFSGESVFRATNTPGQLENIIVDVNHIVPFGVHMQNTNTSVALLRNVTVTGATSAGAGFLCERAQAAVFDGLIAISNDGDGFLVLGCNAAKFSNFVSKLNEGHGLVVQSQVYQSTTFSGGAYFFNGNIERNEDTPVYVSGTKTPVILQDLWIEQVAGTDGILVDDSEFVNILNSRISGAYFSAIDNRAIRLKNASANALIKGNSIAHSTAGGSAYAAIELEAGSHNNRVLGNSHPNTDAPVPVHFQDRNTLSPAAHAAATAPPTVGIWKVGDVVWNTNPTTGQPPGWVCVSESPLQWAKMAALEAM